MLLWIMTDNGNVCTPVLLNFYTPKISLLYS